MKAQPEQHDGKCDMWLWIGDRRCMNKSKHTVVLTKSEYVRSVAVGGTYAPGTYHFCGMHHNAFQRNRTNRSKP